MIHQYALEPTCLNTWERFRFFLSQFGPDTGRLIVEFPNDYRHRLLELVRNLPDEQRARVEELFKRAHHAKKFCTRARATYDSARPWVANAIAEHRRDPLAAVIAREPVKHATVVAADDVHDQHPSFRVQRSRTVARDAAAIADALAPLLRLGGEVHFVDPYVIASSFNNQEAWVSERHLEVLNAVLARGRGLGPVHYHARKHPAFDASSGERCLRRALPPDLAFTLWLWPPRSLHNRFVLTSYAGVEFGHGLDEWQHHAVTDDVTLLAPDHWETRLAEYRAAGARGAHPVRIRTRVELERERVSGCPASGSSLGIQWKPKP